MYTEVEGFILTETNYSESSKILNILTKEYGLIGVIAKGAKRIKSSLRSTAQKYTYGKFQIKYKEDKLSILISVDVIDYLRYIRSDLIAISYLSYIVDLTHQTYNESFDKDIYDLFINSVLKLEEGLDPVVLANILELKYLKYLGVELDLFLCSKCLESKDIKTIDINSGELICSNCIKDEVLINDKIIKLLRMYNVIDINSISDIKIELKYRKIINRYLKNYYDNYTGLHLYSKQFIENFEL